MPRRGALLFPLLILLAGAFLIREAAHGWLAPLEKSWFTSLARRIPPTSGEAPVTLVVIDDDALSKHTWPWASDQYALFLNAVLPFDPAVVGIAPILRFDPGFTGIEREPLYEKMLHDAVLRSPKLVLGGELGWSPEPDAVQPLHPMPVLLRLRGDVTRLPTFTAVTHWAEESYRLSTQPGWLNAPEAAAASTLRGPLVFNYRGQPVPSLALQLLLHWKKTTADQADGVLGSNIQFPDGQAVLLDAHGHAPFHPGVKIARISLEDLLLVREQIERKETPRVPETMFKNRIILLARTDAASRTIPLADGTRISAGEHAAQMLASQIVGLQPTRIGEWFSWLFVALMSVPAFWLHHTRATTAALLITAVEVLYVLAAWLVWKSSLVALPITLPAGLALWVLLLRVTLKKYQRVIEF